MNLMRTVRDQASYLPTSAHLHRLLPPNPFGRALLVRTAVIWLFLHGAMAVGSGASGVPFPRSIIGAPVAVLWLTAATVAALRFEMWRQRELVFLANLGFSSARLGTTVVFVCLLLEIALRLTVA